MSRMSAPHRFSRIALPGLAWLLLRWAPCLVLLGGCLADETRSPVPREPAMPARSTTAGPVVLNEDFSGRQIFPLDNWWNLDISQAPVDPRSAEIITWIGTTRRLHPDFGPPPYGIPYIGVAGDQELLPIEFVLYGEESDPGAPGRPPGYPVPLEARTLPNYIEGGVPGGGDLGDRHMLIIDRDRWLLFETWATHWDQPGQLWQAGSGAAWDMTVNGRRPEGWTSADAAGLAIFPGLIRYEDASVAGEAQHAFRCTVRATDGYVWPASHAAGGTEGAPPLGARLRLRASTDLSGFPLEVRRLFQAMKTYGLIVADNGSDLYIQGTMDGRWNNDVLNPAFQSLHASDFEVIELGWNPVPSSVPEE
jgi:hypothetical protein